MPGWCISSASVLFLIAPMQVSFRPIFPKLLTIPQPHCLFAIWWILFIFKALLNRSLPVVEP